MCRYLHFLLLLLLPHAAAFLSADPNSCAGRCYKYDKGAACQCNWNCGKYKDCCHDFNATCNHPKPPAPPPPPPPPLVGGPQQLHLSLGRAPSEMVLSFATAAGHCASAPRGSCACSYSARNTTDASGDFDTKAPATTYTYTNGSWIGALHRVLFDKLQPSTTYFYTCDQASRVFSFQSAPAAKHFPVTIGAVADLGSDCDTEGCGNATIKSLAAAASTGDIDFVLHAGDIAYTSGRQQIWDAYLEQTESFAARVPYQVCPGNHEHYLNFTGYRWRFAMTPGRPGAGVDGPQGPIPVNNLWSSFKFGGVEFFGLSTEHAFENGSPQHAWLSSALKASAADASVSLRVVFAHRPAYCSTSDYYDCKQAGPKKIRPALAPLFEQYGVDLFLAGHLHNYERSFPVSASGEVLRESYNWTAAQQREEQKEEEEAVARVGGAPKVKQGTVHMVIGNAGDNEGLTYVWEQPKPSWVAFRNTTLGWARITARDENHMLVEMVESGNVGRVIDSFTLVKP